MQHWNKQSRAAVICTCMRSRQSDTPNNRSYKTNELTHHRLLSMKPTLPWPGVRRGIRKLLPPPNMLSRAFVIVIHCHRKHFNKQIFVFEVTEAISFPQKRHEYDTHIEQFLCMSLPARPLQPPCTLWSGSRGLRMQLLPWLSLAECAERLNKSCLAFMCVSKLLELLASLQ